MKNKMIDLFSRIKIRRVFFEKEIMAGGVLL
jgi:hypothetical protein